ncbi:MAG: class I SAM-dependent methyltransferase [Planctomycetes bacterium]|nr:class I SAM-dependent methyltransferase [Planctomycetota bacterium]
MAQRRSPTTTRSRSSTSSTGRKKAAKKRPKKAAKKKSRFTARTADRHVLYQISVQAPEVDARIYSRWFKNYTGRELRVLREDFCGTAVLACHHILRHPDNRAIGVDLDGPTLAWGREHNVDKLLNDEQKQRLLLLQKNVLEVRSPKADAILALNFSYSVFQTRKLLGDYLKNCFASLKPGGMLFADAWGGPDVLKQKTDKSRKGGFTYEWEQVRYDPISHHIDCAIHFSFPDGTRMKNAFVYDWRLWTLAELRELFTDAGFEDVHVLWEGTNHKTGGGNGVFKRKEVGDMDEAWISIVVGRKPA